MLLKKIDINETTTKNLYESSNIIASSYNSSSNALVIVFKNGTQYLYNGVDYKDYLRFETAESQGKVLNSHIKKYSFTKLENADLDKLLEEIESDKEDYLLNLVKTIETHMSNFKENNDIKSNKKKLLTVNLIELLTEYEKLLNEHGK